MTKKTKGISLIEILMLCVITAVIVLTCLHYFHSNKPDMNVTKAIQQVQTIAKASYEWLDAQEQDNFSNNPSGISISLQSLLDNHFINKSKQTDPWSGKIIISPGSNPNHIRITMYNIPKKSCHRLAERLDSVSKITMPTCNHQKNTYSGEF